MSVEFTVRLGWRCELKGRDHPESRFLEAIIVLLSDSCLPASFCSLSTASGSSSVNASARSASIDAKNSMLVDGHLGPRELQLDSRCRCAGTRLTARTPRCSQARSVGFALLQPHRTVSWRAALAKARGSARAPPGEDGDNSPLLPRWRGVEKFAGCSGSPPSVGSLRKSTHVLQASRMGLRARASACRESVAAARRSAES